MQYRKTDAPDSTVVTIKLSLGQIKVLETLVSYELGDAESGTSSFEEKPLQRLIDLFHPILHIKLTPEEEKAAMLEWRKSYTKKEYEEVHGVKL